MSSAIPGSEDNRRKDLTGRTSSKTTEIYTHVSRRDTGNIKSPLDVMMHREVGDD